MVANIVIASEQKCAYDTAMDQTLWHYYTGTVRLYHYKLQLWIFL